jgi:hypothetical protein
VPNYVRPVLPVGGRERNEYSCPKSDFHHQQFVGVGLSDRWSILLRLRLGLLGWRVVHVRSQSTHNEFRENATERALTKPDQRVLEH